MVPPKLFFKVHNRLPVPQTGSLRFPQELANAPFSWLLYYSGDLSPAHHDASTGFASNACCGLFPPGHHCCCRGPGEPSEINEQVVARVNHEDAAHCDIRTMRMLSALEHTIRRGGETSQPYRADEGGSGPLMVYCCDEKKENQTNDNDK